MTPETLELQELFRETNDALVTRQVLASGAVYGDPPWEIRPSDAMTFYPKTSVALPAVGSEAAAVTFVLPDGFDGVLEEFSINFAGGGFVNGSGDLSFRLQRNGAPVRNFENMTSEYGTQDTPVSIGSLRTYSGDVWTIVVNHVANGALAGNVIGCLRGYYYPSRGR